MKTPRKFIIRVFPQNYITNLNTIVMIINFFHNTGDSLSQEDTISSHAVHSKVECSLKCLQTTTCVGYNYRSETNKYAVNCQLSNKARESDKESNAKEKWNFYRALEVVRRIKALCDTCAVRTFVYVLRSAFVSGCRRLIFC